MNESTEGDGKAVTAIDADVCEPTRQKESLEPANRSRRLLLAAVAGGAAFYGPWKANHAWAQTAQKKPLVIGLTMDASGQYAASGVEERLGAMMAIKEFNDKGGVLGRRIEALHIDTETTPATGSRRSRR